MSETRSGRCACGAVRYEVSGETTKVTYCHCSKCRRWHGHVGAYTAAPKGNLKIVEGRGLKWYASSEKARRGFCGECGGTLFYDPLQKDHVSITAGTLDPPTGLKTTLQIYCASAGDYYEIDPAIPQREN